MHHHETECCAKIVFCLFGQGHSEGLARIIRLWPFVICQSHIFCTTDLLITRPSVNKAGIDLNNSVTYCLLCMVKKIKHVATTGTRPGIGEQFISVICCFNC